MRYTFAGLLSGMDEPASNYKGGIRLAGRRGDAIAGATLMSPTKFTDFVLDFDDSDHHEVQLEDVRRLMNGETVHGFVLSKPSRLALFAWMHQTRHL